MNKVRVRFRKNSKVLIHNDLSNTAFYFNERIQKRVLDDDHDGIALEIMAALIMTAFAVEANINFLGQKLIEDWDERQGLVAKVEVISEHLAIQPDWNIRPFSTIVRLRNFRNTLAHGKPETVTVDEEIVCTREELEERGWPLKADWQELLTPEFLADAYADMEALWKLYLQAAGLGIFETLSGGSHSIEFIEELESSAAE